MVATGSGKNPVPTTSPSVPQTTPALLPMPVITETAGARRRHPSPATTYRVRSILISLQQVISVIVVTLLLPLTLCASIGAIIIITGYYLTSTTDPVSFTNASAASIGVVGSLILSPLLYLICLPNLVPTSPGVSPLQRPSPTFLTSIVIFFPFYSTLIGVIGSSVLLNRRVDLGGIDISNASFAGLIGGFIFIIGGILGCFCVLLLSGVFNFIISSIRTAIIRGVQWVHVKLTENWKDKSHSEINTELQDVPPGRD